MTPSDSNDDSIRSPVQFGNALQRIVRLAHDSGVAIEGGWDCTYADTHVEYDVVISRVERRTETTD